MAEFNFDFDFVRSGAPIVTLSSIGLAFNAGARSLLGYPNKVDIGYDEHAKALAIRPHDSESGSPSYDFEPRAKNGWIRISMRDFMKFLSLRTGIDFLSKAAQFIPELDQESGMLIVLVDEKHMKDKRRTN